MIIGNNPDKISGLIDTSLSGTVLSKPYRRPDIINSNGVFDDKYMKNKINTHMMQTNVLKKSNQ